MMVEESTDATTSTTTLSDEDEKGISTLLNAAASIETDKKPKSVSKSKKKKARAVSVSEVEQRMTGISTLLHAATAIPVPGSTSKKKGDTTKKAKKGGDIGKKDDISRSKKRPATEEAGSDGEDDLPIRPRGSRPGDELFYPTEEELKEATTRRGRNALFSWYDRLRDLYEYKSKHGDCMVPQKYELNHALGIVRTVAFQVLLYRFYTRLDVYL